jgi:hypothetical protein
MPENYPTSKYWNNTGDPSSDNLQVGDTGSWRSHTLLNFDLNVAQLAGATIYGAEIDLTDNYSFSCTQTDTNIYAPTTATLNATNAYWNYWFGSASTVNLGPVVDHPHFAHGYNSGSCPAANVGFDVTSAVSAAVLANHNTQTFVLTGASNETSDPNSWKKFSLSSLTMTVTYNHLPNQPTGLSSSPATACPANSPSTVGDGPVTLYAPVSDPDADVPLGVTFSIWKTSTGTSVTSSNPATLTVPSGQTAVFTVAESLLKNAAGSGITQFSWSVQAKDQDPNQSGPVSAVCSFNFDPTRTGAPVITPPAPGSTTIGSPFTVPVNHPVSGSLPTSYLYQVNGGPPGTATADGSGNASISITPTRFTNTVTVTGRSAGGNIGDTAAVTFNASPAATAADADLTGDGTPDLLTVGSTANSVPPGLWLATGQSSGQVKAPAADIGANGNGVNGTNAPSDFAGAQVLSGHFTGSPLQDVLAYYPGAANGVILNGNGDGSTLQAQLSGNESTISAGTLTDNNGLNPSQIASAGNSSGQHLAYPDLIAVSGDAANGYYLDYYPNMDFVGGYGWTDQLSVSSPDGTMDWNQWTVATAQLPTTTAMFLWNRSTGALYLWTNLAHTPFGGADLAHTSYTLRASGWNTGANLTLQAADINHDGSPDLWSVGAGGTVTASLVTGLGGSPTVTAQPSQVLITGNHAWLLNDASTGAVSSAKDTVATLHATDASGATWNTGDLFSPDVVLDGVSGHVSTPTQAVPTNADFTVSAWVKPSTLGGVVLSQDGTSTTGFVVYVEPTDRSWRFAMSTVDSSTPTWDIAAAPVNSVQLGIWTHVTATYHQSTGVMDLGINGTRMAVAGHHTSFNATGRFQLGQATASPASTNAALSGQLANVQTWTVALDPDTVSTVHLGPTGDTDVNGDGRADLVNQSTASVAVLPSTGLAYAAPSTWSNVTFNGSTANLIGDINGDGYADLVAQSPNWVYVELSNGTSFGPPTAWSSVAFSGTTANLIGDINGDGRADLIAQSPNWTYVELSTGTSFGPPTAWSSVAFSGTTANLIGDINGDGRADLIAQSPNWTYVELSTGTAFGTPTWWSSSAVPGNVANFG